MRVAKLLAQFFRLRLNLQPGFGAGGGRGAVALQTDLKKWDCCRAAGRQCKKHSKSNIQQSCGAARALSCLAITASFIT